MFVSSSEQIFNKSSIISLTRHQWILWSEWELSESNQLPNNQIHKNLTFHWIIRIQNGGKFFSNRHWPPQLTSPFYSIHFETFILQFNSSKLYPIMPDEVREHLTRDQRPFLHPESLQILQIHSSMTVLLLFSSPHSCSTGFRSEDWNGQSRS